MLWRCYERNARCAWHDGQRPPQTGLNQMLLAGALAVECPLIVVGADDIACRG